MSPIMFRLPLWPVSPRVDSRRRCVAEVAGVARSPCSSFLLAQGTTLLFRPKANDWTPGWSGRPAPGNPYSPLEASASACPPTSPPRKKSLIAITSVVVTERDARLDLSFFVSGESSDSLPFFLFERGN